uniref:THO complex subunit 4C n=1 Tax=Noccaea caerulescens TaxID=107243 RepID=A0A1J3K279_NOCCA
MSDSLNMTLDEIVKRSKTAAKSSGVSKGISRRGRGAKGSLGAGRGAGPVRRGPLAVNARQSSFSINKLARRKRNFPLQSDLFEASLRAAGVSGVEIGTTVYVTNLDQGVTNDDIRELFGEVGEVKRFAIHYDQNGRPNGSAEVVYMRRSDAFQAMKRYNNVLLDGRSMRLEIVGGGNTEAAPSVAAARVNVSGLSGRKKRTVSIRGGRGGGRGRSAAPSVRRLPIGSQNKQGVSGGRGGFRGGRGRGGGGRGAKSGRGGKKSAAELDKDLESYHAEAMNIS